MGPTKPPSTGLEQRTLRSQAPARGWLRAREVTVRGALVAAGLALVAAGCGGSDITRPRIEGSLGPVFDNLYVQQQTLLGHPGLAPAQVGAKPVCHRSTPGTHDQGAGSDWICQVTWTDHAGKSQNGKFELQVRSNGCYQAGGPSKLVGPITIQTAGGKTVTNPAFEFDGCFDTT
jgi:hypothetical protein